MNAVAVRPAIKHRGMNPPATGMAWRREARYVVWRYALNAAARRLTVGRRFSAGIRKQHHPRRVATVERARIMRR